MPPLSVQPDYNGKMKGEDCAIVACFLGSKARGEDLANITPLGSADTVSDPGSVLLHRPGDFQDSRWL